MSPRKDDPPTRKGVVAVGAVAATAIVMLLLGRKGIEGYLGGAKSESPADEEAADTGGPAGTVKLAGGAPAAGANVRIGWRDEKGPNASTAVVGPDGRWSVTDVPPGATLTDISAAIGPLATKKKFAEEVGSGGSGRRFDFELPSEFGLAGLVRRRGDRASVPGATLTLGGLRVVAGTDGDFKLEHVPAAVAQGAAAIVRIEAPGYKPLDWPIPRFDAPEQYGDLTILMEEAK